MIRSQEEGSIKAGGNVEWALGKPLQWVVVLADREETQLHVLSRLREVFIKTDRCVIGVRVSPAREFASRLVGALGRKQPPARTLSAFQVQLQHSQMRIVRVLAVFPSLESPRFLLPYQDHDSHRTLFEHVFLPRRYSLSLPMRVLLRIYMYLLQVLPRPTFLYRDLVVLVEPA